MENKIVKKMGTFWLVLVLTFFTKLLEYIGQYSFNKYIVTLNIFLFQLSFILSISIILYLGFNYVGVKKKSNYLIIPVLSYFIKEVFNFIFVYGKVINLVTVSALVFEPLLLYGLIWTLNKYYLRIKW